METNSLSLVLFLRPKQLRLLLLRMLLRLLLLLLLKQLLLPLLLPSALNPKRPTSAVYAAAGHELTQGTSGPEGFPIPA